MTALLALIYAFIWTIVGIAVGLIPIGLSYLVEKLILNKIWRRKK